MNYRPYGEEGLASSMFYRRNTIVKCSTFVINHTDKIFHRSIFSCSYCRRRQLLSHFLIHYIIEEPCDELLYSLPVTGKQFNTKSLRSTALYSPLLAIHHLIQDVFTFYSTSCTIPRCFKICLKICFV